MAVDASNPFSLRGKRILVTGASSGIGRACAQVCDRLGASLILTARSEERLRETFESLENRSLHRVVACDLTDFDAISRLFAENIDRESRLSGLIDAAGSIPVYPLDVVSRESIREAMDVNFVAFMELVRLFSQKKHREPESGVVGISSVSAFAGWAGASVYCATKGALTAAIRALAIELVPKKIRVNAVVPSNLATEGYRRLTRANSEERNRKILESQPLGVGTPEDAAYAAAFLLSDAAKFITGSFLTVDGGYLAR